jgi:hypothetical protein
MFWVVVWYCSIVLLTSYTLVPNSHWHCCSESWRRSTRAKSWNRTELSPLRNITFAHILYGTEHGTIWDHMGHHSWSHFWTLDPPHLFIFVSHSDSLRPVCTVLDGQGASFTVSPDLRSIRSSFLLKNITRLARHQQKWHKIDTRWVKHRVSLNMMIFDKAKS